MAKTRILAVVGPTATGKTALAVKLAKRIGGEIISCDSMQIYEGMKTGTAAPSEETLDGIPCFLTGFVSPFREYNVAEYVRDAAAAAEDIIKRGKIPVFCGGTGLYLDAFIRGGLPEEEADAEYRESLRAFAECHDPGLLHGVLQRVDAESAEKIHPNNVRRVIRALEIYRSSGKTKSETDAESNKKDRKYDFLIMGLKYKNRADLYAATDKRVGEMISAGLRDEVEILYKKGLFEKRHTAAQAIGYKEIARAIENGTDIEKAAEEIRLATRRYAKRQLTWFLANKEIVWFDRETGSEEETDEIADKITGEFRLPLC